MLPDLFLVLHNTVTCTCLSLSWNCRLTVWNCFLLCMCVCLLCRRESNSFVKTSRLRCINTCRLLDYQASCRLKVTDLSPVFVFSRRRGRRKPATVQTLLKKPTSAGWWTPVNTGRALHPSGPSARKKNIHWRCCFSSKLEKQEHKLPLPTFQPVTCSPISVISLFWPFSHFSVFMVTFFLAKQGP